VERAETHGSRLALAAAEGELTYVELLDASARVAAALLDGAADLEEARVAFLLPPGLAHVAFQWGVWRAGGVAVPLCLSHPAPELEHVLTDSAASIVVGPGEAAPELDERLAPLAHKLGLRYLTLGEAGGGGRGTAAGGAQTLRAPSHNLPGIAPTRRALMVYTSGTTGKPKGVVTTHAQLTAQIEALVAAWGWSAEDRILHVLPLHHVHGIVNVLLCALWSGAVCEMLPRFDAEEVWRRFASGRITLFMAVPTLYSRLVAAWEQAPEATRERWSEAARGLRLMVSGSAALPVSVLERWEAITGHRLLERYGMTEIGMALSNPLVGERRAGTVGRPLPGVEVRRVDEAGRVLGPGEEAVPGELEVRGPAVFGEYWGRPEATRQAFRTGGWFRTGDVAVVEAGGYYRLLGRQSVDIVKTGGYKVSALEIEEVLRTHPAVAECAVVGVPDEEWGERVAVAVVPREGEELTLEALRTWAKQRLAPYKVPTLLRLVPELPRNALGKVTKPAVRAGFVE
jgi:malonyl-CoA/methylmalonyl-CoA synthetase